MNMGTLSTTHDSGRLVEVLIAKPKEILSKAKKSFSWTEEKLEEIFPWPKPTLP